MAQVIRLAQQVLLPNELSPLPVSLMTKLQQLTFPPAMPHAHQYLLVFYFFQFNKGENTTLLFQFACISLPMWLGIYIFTIMGRAPVFFVNFQFTQGPTFHLASDFSGMG